MEKISIFILTALFTIFTASLFGDSAQQQEVVSWAHKYSYDEGSQILGFTPIAAFATSDGGFLISSGNLLKLNAFGEPEWLKSYSCDCGIVKIIETSSGYLAAALVDLLEESYIIVLRIDSSGNLIWSKRVRRNQFDTVHSLIRTRDGGYLLGAFSASRKDAKAWLIKLSDSGNIQWQKTYNVARPNSLHQLNNGDFLVGTDQFSVLKLTRSGNVRWQKKFSRASCCSHGIMQTDGEDGFFLAGNQTTNSVYSVLVLRVDSLGSIVFSKTYSNQRLEDFTQTSDGGPIILSSRDSFPASRNMSISKLDRNGNVKWRRISKFRHLLLSPQNIIQAKDGGYLATATDNGFVLKLNQSGNIPNSCINVFTSATSTVHNFSINVEERFPKVATSNAVPIIEDFHAFDVTPIVESICQ